MVVELFFNMLFSVIDFIISILPSFSLNVGSFAGFVEVISFSSFIVPWSTLLQALGVWVVFQSIKFIANFVNWLIAKIPTID